MRILFIFQVNSHARYLRRHRKLKEYFEEVKIFSFTRDFYKTTEKNEFISLGHIENENYFRRISKIIKAIFILKKHLKKNDIVYTFGLDTFYIAYIASILKFKSIKIVYEVGDIRRVFTTKGFRGSMFRFFERRTLKRATALIVTSPMFITKYFNDIQKFKKKNIFLIENKPDIINQMKVLNKNLEKDKITIGFFGMIRCERSLLILSKLVQMNKTFVLYIRGIIDEELIHKFKLSNLENVIIGNEYEASKDLPELYSNIDMCWTAYPYSQNQLGNQFWAMTTRFYEAVYFKTPLITRKDGADSDFVTSNKIGITLDFDDVDKSIQILENLNKETISIMKKNLNDVDQSIYQYSNEHEKLANFLIKDGK